MSDVSFTIIICTRDRVDMLRETVDLVMQRLVDFPNARLVVIDNASADGTSEYLRMIAGENDRIIVDREATPGLYHARVRGLAHAGGDFIVFLDDDVLPRNNWPGALLAELIRDPTVGVVGTAIDPIWDHDRPAWMTKRFERDIPIFSIAGGLQTYRFPQYPPGVCLALRACDFLILYSSPERREAGLGWTARSGASDPLCGDDWDLSELYLQNGYSVIAVDHVRVGHRVVTEKLTPAWILRKFESDARGRIRYARLAGHPVFSWPVLILLATFPALWSCALVLRAAKMQGPRSLTIQAYAKRARGTWHELLWGIRGVRFPFKLAA